MSILITVIAVFLATFFGVAAGVWFGGKLLDTTYRAILDDIK
jgi:hypothetical protein